MIRVEITDAPIVPAALLEEVADGGNGATALFVGTVRSVNDGRRVVAVSYDVFEPLAKKTIEEICREAQAASEDSIRLVVVHRRGRLAVGEASVAVAAGSPHRAEAYEASRYAIEQLKIRAPIWKKEHYEDGETEWLKGHELCAHGGSHSRRGPLHAHGAGQGDAGASRS